VVRVMVEAESAEEAIVAVKRLAEAVRSVLDPPPPGSALAPGLEG